MILISGGIHFNSTVPLTYLNERLCSAILRDYRILNADILIREDIDVDQFVDVVLGNRKYVKCLVKIKYNFSTYITKLMLFHLKKLVLTIMMVDKLARTENVVVVSCEMKLNLDYLVERIWGRFFYNDRYVGFKTSIYQKERSSMNSFDFSIQILEIV